MNEYKQHGFYSRTPSIEEKNENDLTSDTNSSTSPISNAFILGLLDIAMTRPDIKIENLNPEERKRLTHAIEEQFAKQNIELTYRNTLENIYQRIKTFTDQTEEVKSAADEIAAQPPLVDAATRFLIALIRKNAATLDNMKPATTYIRLHATPKQVSNIIQILSRERAQVAQQLQAQFSENNYSSPSSDEKKPELEEPEYAEEVLFTRPRR